MRTEVLQIGNTVQLRDGREVTVEAIHKRKIGYHAVQDRLAWVFAGNVEPVPFDPKRHLVQGRHCKVDAIENPFGGCFVTVAIGFGNKAEANVTYLHEVQNLVRMYDNLIVKE